MHIEQINPKLLKPYDKNSRTHSETQVEQIVKSIEEFGFTNPVLISHAGQLIAGHGRVMAAIKMGLATVPTIKLENLTEAQIRAYVIADNKLALNAGWDVEMLIAELDELKSMDFDIALTGFSLDEMEDLRPEQLFEGEAHEDDVGEPEELRTVIGDLWQLGDHFLKCGDSTVIDHVQEVLDKGAPNLMVTDPPYGVKYEAGWPPAARGKETVSDREKTSNLQNDDRSDWYDTYALFPGNVAYIWHASAFTDVVMDGLRRANLEPKQQIVWNKSHMVLSRSNYHWKHEPCWYAIRNGATHSWKGGRSQTTIWDVDGIQNEKNDDTKHPTQKPVELYTRAILNHTNKNDFVYDPFCGSGTAIIAAEKTGRRALCLELDPKFCDVIINRWERYTKKIAVRIEQV